ncbi:hypothetical protein OCU04_008846 [Sclerotinia nivalis]|uniref:Uncharacterized protein n=1 Tax=Sclerotinia nivalis TaxID=352851 RepID=A0A9X0AGB1_9HELO|nr:hypothetical protein OCU04_008846 [Sclerotinia nivalis]
MTTVRSIIQKLQAYNEDDTIEDLLDNSEFVQEIAELIKLLAKAKTNVSEIILNQEPKQKLPTKKDTNRVLKSIRKITHIELTGEVLEKYRECQQYPFKFWSWAGIQVDLTADKTKPIEIFFSQAYMGIRRLETKRQWDTIIWRFFVLFFYDLVKVSGRKNLTASFENQLACTLASTTTSIQDTNTKIRENLRRWVSAGSRYAQLSNSLGYGAPFLLPLSVADNTWETKLPLKGPIYTSTVEHLESKSFREKSKELGADALGAEIREAILQPFRWNLSTFTQNTHSSSYRDSTDTGGSTGLRGEGGTEAGPSTFRSNCNSIDTLLNPVEPTQGQQLSSIENSSFQITSETVLNECSHDVIVGELSGIGSKGKRRDLEPQIEVQDLSSKRRRIDLSSSPDSSIPRPSSGTTYNRQGGTIETPTPGNTNIGPAHVHKLESVLASCLFKDVDATHIKRERV